MTLSTTIPAITSWLLLIVFSVQQVVHSFTIQCSIFNFQIHHNTNIAITSRPNIRTTGSACCRTALKAIEVPSLESLDNIHNKSHDEEGSRLAKSIIGWLDREWIPQDVHVQMANCVKDTYVKARHDGETEIMNVMTKVVDDLNQNWSSYDKDAFVSAWDIGNYVSDYLHLRIDPINSCGCSVNIYDPDQDTN